MVKKGVKPVAGILGVVSKAFSFSIGSFRLILVRFYKIFQGY